MLFSSSQCPHECIQKLLIKSVTLALINPKFVHSGLICRKMISHLIVCFHSLFLLLALLPNSNPVTVSLTERNIYCVLQSSAGLRQTVLGESSPSLFLCHIHRCPFSPSIPWLSLLMHIHVKPCS